VNLAELRITNFRSYGPTTTLRFPVDTGTNGRNVVLVGGMNGAGKTALLDAIRIALYGGRPNDVRQDLNRTEVRHGRLCAEFALRLVTDDGEPISVVRQYQCDQYQAKTGRDADPMVLLVGRGDRVPEPTDGEQWLSEIETLVPREVSQFFFFDGEQVQQFASDDVRDTLRRGMETLLGIDLVLRLQADMKALHDEARKRPLVTDADLRVRQASRDQAAQQLTMVEDRLRDLRTEQGEVATQLAGKRDEFAARFGPSSDQRRSREMLEQERTRLHARIAELYQQIKTETDNSLAIRMLGDLSRQVLEALLSGQSSGWACDPAATARVVQLVTDALTKPSMPCCGAIANERTLARVRERVLRALDRGTGTGHEQGSLGCHSQLSDEDRDRAVRRIKDIRDEPTAKLLALLGSVADLENQLQATEVDLRDWEDAQADENAFRQCQSELDDLNQRVGRIRNEIASCEDERARLEASIEGVDVELGQILEQCEVSRTHAAYAKQLSGLHALLGEYVTSLRERKATEVAEAVTDMYRRLASKGDRIGRVTIDRNAYGILIEAPDGSAIERRSLSAGEKEVFAISLLWGLARCAQVKLPVVIDTPLSRLDSLHRDRIVSDYLPYASHQVIVLSTDTEVDRAYYRRLTPHVAHAMRLELSAETGTTTVREGYFWEE